MSSALVDEIAIEEEFARTSLRRATFGRMGGYFAPYKRRLVHQIAKPYNLDTDSRGEEPERHVCLIKSSESKLPKGVSGPRLWDFGSLTLPVNPGDDGLRMALKVDGSVEIWRQNQSHLVLAERVVTSSQIRIRKGKIVQPGEPDW